jgi:hypothetical protein
LLLYIKALQNPQTILNDFTILVKEHEMLERIPTGMARLSEAAEARRVPQPVTARIFFTLRNCAEVIKWFKK